MPVDMSIFTSGDGSKCRPDEGSSFMLGEGSSFMPVIGAGIWDGWFEGSGRMGSRIRIICLLFLN